MDKSKRRVENNKWKDRFLSMLEKILLKLRRCNKKRLLLSVAVLLLLYYLLVPSYNNNKFSSAIACKSDLAKIVLPNEHKRLDYIQPVGTDFNAMEDDFYYFLTTLTTNCKSQQHLGPAEDGGWDVCVERRYDVAKNCLVYSFGVSEDFAFEKDVERVLKCEIHAFDPSLGLKPFQFSTKGHFHDHGIDSEETIDVKTGWKLKRLRNIMQDLGHSGRSIYLLKMDVEYSEWLVLHDLITSKLINDIRQLALEVHTPEMDVLARPKHHCSTTNPETLAFMFRILVDLRNAGFSLFSSRTNHRISFPSQISGKHRFCCHNLHFVNNKHPSNAF